MENKKVAIIVDTAIDVPQAFVDRYHIFEVPITVIFSDGEFRDHLDITPCEVYERLKQEIPKTSLPSGEMIQTTFDQVVDEGYTQALIFTMSSQMSGTNNLFKLMAEEEKRLETFVFDTRSIGLGGGLFAIEAAEALENDKTFEYIIDHICSDVTKSKLFGKFETFDFLQKGGRVGLVTAKIGSLLNIKPIISVNEDGVIYTAAKVKGDKKARKEMLKLIDECIHLDEEYDLLVLDGENHEEAMYFTEMLKEKYPQYRLFEEHIGSALGIHTGPGMVIVGAYRKNKG